MVPSERDLHRVGRDLRLLHDHPTILDRYRLPVMHAETNITEPRAVQWLRKEWAQHGAAQGGRHSDHGLHLVQPDRSGGLGHRAARGQRPRQSAGAVTIWTARSGRWARPTSSSYQTGRTSSPHGVWYSSSATDFRTRSSAALELAESPVRLRPAVAVELPHVAHLADLVEVEVRGDQLVLVARAPAPGTGRADRRSSSGRRTRRCSTAPRSRRD